jgi:hypothetical protein
MFLLVTWRVFISVTSYAKDMHQTEVALRRRTLLATDGLAFARFGVTGSDSCLAVAALYGMTK